MELDKDKVGSLLLKFSIPAIAGMVANALYNVVDRMYIGHGVSAIAFSSLTVTMPLAMIVMAFAMLVGFGSAPLISINLGRHDKDAAEKVVGNGIMLLLIVSVFLTVFGMLFIHPLLLLFGGSEATLSYAEDYMNIIFGGVAFQVVGFGMTHMMRASGNPRASMYTMLVGAGLNCILDPIFIFGFKWGIQGAAYATILSQLVSMLYVLSYFLGPKSHLRIRPRYFRLEAHIVWRILSVGVSSFATQLANSAVFTVANSQIMRHGGDLAMGAMGLINSFAMLFMMPVFGLSHGSQPIIGYNYGAERFDRVRETLRYTLSTAFVFGLVGWLLVQFATDLVILMFTTDPDLTATTRGAIRTYLFTLPIIGPQLLGAVFFQAIGQARKALILSMLRQVIILIPMYLLLPRWWGLDGVWRAAPITDALAFCVTAYVFGSNIMRLKPSTV